MCVCCVRAHAQTDLLDLWQTKASLICKVPCLLNLPPINLEWPTSFFGYFLYSPDRLDSDFTQEVWSLQTNTYYLFFIV